MAGAGIETVFWQAKIGGLGETVSGLADLEQSIRLIVQTPLGSVPLAPEFGCDILAWIDRPAHTAAPAIAREIGRALARWEKRVEIAHVRVVRISGHTAHIEIKWRPSAAGAAAYHLLEIAA